MGESRNAEREWTSAPFRFQCKMPKGDGVANTWLWTSNKTQNTHRWKMNKMCVITRKYETLWSAYDAAVLCALHRIFFFFSRHRTIFCGSLILASSYGSFCICIKLYCGFGSNKRDDQMKVLNSTSTWIVHKWLQLTFKGPYIFC